MESLMTTNENVGDGDAADLEISRFIATPPALVWRAWTEPEHLKQWLATCAAQLVAVAERLKKGS